MAIAFYFCLEFVGVLDMGYKSIKAYMLRSLA